MPVLLVPIAVWLVFYGVLFTVVMPLIAKHSEDLSEAKVCLLDPMLATGNSAVAAAQQLKDLGAKRISFACILAAPEGIKTFQAAHPDIRIFTAAVDEGLTDNAYITPGLGDAGDRYFGTL